MSSTGTTTDRSNVLAAGGCTTVTVAAAGEERRDLLDRAHRGRQPDPLRRPVQQRVEALQADGKVRAALGAGDGVDLVEDHGLYAAQRLSRLLRSAAGTATPAW